jgi:hypothetical protein
MDISNHSASFNWYGLVKSTRYAPFDLVGLGNLMDQLDQVAPRTKE